MEDKVSTYSCGGFIFLSRMICGVEVFLGSLAGGDLGSVGCEGGLWGFGDGVGEGERGVVDTIYKEGGVGVCEGLKYSEKGKE